MASLWISTIVGVNADATPHRYLPIKSYADVISVSPSMSSGRVITLQATGQDGTNDQTETARRLVDLNRNRSGNDININGASMKAEPPASRLRRDSRRVSDA